MVNVDFVVFFLIKAITTTVLAVFCGPSIVLVLMDIMK